MGPICLAAVSQGRLADLWTWLTQSNSSLALRISAGAALFLIWALLDLHRHGRQATRWREYLLLLVAVAVAICYGVVNDQITSRISWEYFYYGKGLNEVLGGVTPPEPAKLSWEAAKVGIKATWTVGLLAGVAILLANNPRRDRPQLSFASLLRRMPMVVFSAITCAALLGGIGYAGGLTRLSDDFHQMVRHDEFRPYRFMAVYGIHIGGYIGGAVGTLWAVISIHRARRLIAAGGSRGFPPFARQTAET